MNEPYTILLRRIFVQAVPLDQCTASLQLLWVFTKVFEILLYLIGKEWVQMSIYLILLRISTEGCEHLLF